MRILYQRNGVEWEAFCDAVPTIIGTGIDPDQALEDLAQKLRAITNAVMIAQNKLCIDVDKMIEEERYNPGE
jgi:hypothetical protein